MNTPKQNNINEDSLTISFLQAGSSNALKDGWRHTKTVPFTIIAQPLSGFYTVTCLQETVPIKPGETVLVPANTEVTFEHHSSRNADMSARWVHINWQLFKTIDITSLLEIPLKVGGTASSRFGALIRNILSMQTISAQSTLRSLAQRNELGFTFLGLMLNCSKQKEEISNYINRTKRLQSVFGYINAHLQEQITIDQLALIACLSPSRFFALFKELMSLSPMDYLRRQRISEASRLLLSTDMPIGRIASATGFINQFHFSRIFKEQIGLSPREHRKGDF